MTEENENESYNTESHHYDATVSESKEQSIAKAMEIMLKDIDNYKNNRIIVRPDVAVWKGAVPIAAYLISLCILVIKANDISTFLGIKSAYVLIAIFAVYLLLLLLSLKVLIIWAIGMYQRFAPEKIRRMCYFEPSCSDYMKIAVKKYGVVRGVKKGFNRLTRCHWPNGGIDNP